MSEEIRDLAATAAGPSGAPANLRFPVSSAVRFKTIRNSGRPVLILAFGNFIRIGYSHSAHCEEGLTTSSLQLSIEDMAEVNRSMSKIWNAMLNDEQHSANIAVDVTRPKMGYKLEMGLEKRNIFVFQRKWDPHVVFASNPGRIDAKLAAQENAPGTFM